jgi:hypothetical protein
MAADRNRLDGVARSAGEERLNHQVVSFKSPADTPKCPECRGNPRLLCRGTRSSNPSPSSGESRKPSAPARVVLGLARRATSRMRVGAPTRFLKQDGNISKCPHSEILLVGPFLVDATHRRRRCHRLHDRGRKARTWPRGAHTT